jgi:hypothetical protein
MTKEQIDTDYCAKDNTMGDNPLIITFKDPQREEWVGGFDNYNNHDKENNIWYFIPYKQPNVPKIPYRFNGDEVKSIRHQKDKY